MGCCYAQPGHDIYSSPSYTPSTQIIKSSHSSPFGSNYSSADLVLNSKTSPKYWFYSEKHKNAVRTLCSKSINIPQEITDIIESYLPDNALVVLSRGTLGSAPYESDSTEVKITFMGYAESGKTKVVQRVVVKKYDPYYDPTIEDSYKARVRVNGLGDQMRTVDILDTAGQDEFQAMEDQWIRETKNFVVAFDLTNLKSYKSMKKRLERIARHKEDQSGKIPCILLGCKGDLILDGSKERCVLLEEIIEFCKQQNTPYVECSAKEDINVDVFVQDVLITETHVSHRVS